MLGTEQHRWRRYAISCWPQVDIAGSNRISLLSLVHWRFCYCSNQVGYHSPHLQMWAIVMPSAVTEYMSNMAYVEPSYRLWSPSLKKILSYVLIFNKRTQSSSLWKMSTPTTPIIATTTTTPTTHSCSSSLNPNPVLFDTHHIINNSD